MNLEKLKEDTECGKHLQNLEAFYNSLDFDLKTFDESAGIHCLCESGTCCEHFVPELTPLEAEYMAYILIKEGKVEQVLAKLSHYDRSSGVCPLYNKEGKFHCSLYSGRGLICRLFGAACFIDKEGRGTFRPCRWNKERKNIDISAVSVKKVPIMGDYGRVVDNMEGNTPKSEDIDIALTKAIDKIEFLLSLMEDANDN